jgi:hypothetical protein
MPTLTTSFKIAVGSNIEEARTATTNEHAIETDIALAGGDADIEITESFSQADQSTGELWLISSGQAITVKTNSSGGTDTFEVPAGGAIKVAGLTDDITSLFATNGSETVDTILKLRGVRDATP